MPSPTIIEIECPEYLVKFCETIWGRPDKPQPVFFNKEVGKYYNRYLNQHLENPKGNVPPRKYSDSTLKILLPYFENKDVLYYWHLPIQYEKMLVKIIQEYFDYLFDEEAYQLIRYFNKKDYRLRKKDIINHFMDMYNLPADCWDFLSKRYGRLYRTRPKRMFTFNENNSSVSELNNEPCDENVVFAAYDDSLNHVKHVDIVEIVEIVKH